MIYPEAVTDDEWPSAFRNIWTYTNSAIPLPAQEHGAGFWVIQERHVYLKYLPLYFLSSFMFKYRSFEYQPGSKWHGFRLRDANSPLFSYLLKKGTGLK
ncbi:hypothetical protein AQUCO_01500015v1 [Aquilegia coerulea]|uniref:Uncharacterized protein n=1 Tax=Aquilegia coerulea TaxID=218851 RepID=A0A2G5DRR5_AQUCA|nr:hypothetical protein AQUCO_01500015v1 [Aquilegia coerulea]